MGHDSHPNDLIHAVTEAIQNFTLATGGLPWGAKLSDLRDVIGELDAAVSDIRRAATIFPEATIELTPIDVVDDALGAMLGSVMMPEQIPVRIQVKPRPYEDSRAIMSDLARLDGDRATATWNGKEGILDLSVQLAHLASHIDPYGEDRLPTSWL